MLVLSSHPIILVPSLLAELATKCWRLLDVSRDMVLGTLKRLENIPACDNRPEQRELLHTLIERIDVCPDGRLEVRWAFRHPEGPWKPAV